MLYIIKLALPLTQHRWINLHVLHPLTVQVFHSATTFKPVYKGHWREHENVSFMTSCPLYTGSNYMHYTLNGGNETVLYKQWFVIYKYPLRHVWL